MCANSTIEVRRKTKEMPNGKACWWFVHHDDEARLQAIDAKWEHVELQTSWKLEPCFRLSTAPQVQLPAASVGHFTGDDGASAPETQATAVVFSCPRVPQPKTSTLSQTQPPTLPQQQTSALSTLPQPQTLTVTPDASMVSDGRNTSFFSQQSRASAAARGSLTPKHSNSKLIIVYYNARSLLPKIDELRAITEIKSPNVICIVESWLSSDISDNELVIQDYQIFRLDRDRHGGGVLMYVHSYFAFDLCNSVGDIELLTVSVCPHNSTLKICIALYYRPPSASVKCFDCLSINLFNLNTSLFKHFILIGDFNVNYFCTSSFLYTHLMLCLSPFNLTQVVPFRCISYFCIFYIVFVHLFSSPTFGDLRS